MDKGFIPLIPHNAIGIPMAATMEQRAYGHIRDIIEKHGGTMVYERKDCRYGAWILSLGGKTVIVESEGRHAHPKLDELYVPSIECPQTWDDYKDELRADAEEELLNWFR